MAGGKGAGEGAGGRSVVSGDELRHLASAVNGVVSPIDGVMRRLTNLIGHLDRRGWNAGAVDSPWGQVRSQWSTLRGGLEWSSRDLVRRAALADQLNTWLTRRRATRLSGPAARPGGGATAASAQGGPREALRPAHLSPGLQATQPAAQLLERQALTAMNRLPSGAPGAAPPPAAVPRPFWRTVLEVAGASPEGRAGAPGPPRGAAPIQAGIAAAAGTASPSPAPVPPGTGGAEPGAVRDPRTGRWRDAQTGRFVKAPL
jgi:hypothetical protein